MMLNLRRCLADMEYCAFILRSLLPATWIVVGCLLLILLLIVAVLYVLKSREVSLLKKQVDELRDTMRMMRYEEANLARMLHTASKPVEPIETPEEEDVEGNADGLEVLESQESLEEQQEKEQPQEQQEQQEQEVQVKEMKPKVIKTRSYRIMEGHRILNNSQQSLMTVLGTSLLKFLTMAFASACQPSFPTCPSPNILL